MSAASQPHRFDGQVFLITGAGQGIGAALAEELAIVGRATVILLDRQLPLLEAVYDKITAVDGSQAALYPMDFKGATLDDYQTLSDTIQQEFGRLDGVIHCAASLGQLAPVKHQDVKLWMETLHINLTASYLLTQCCLPLLQQATASDLVFFTDAHNNQAYWGSYGVSKAGIEALSQQLADELEAQGIVNVHCIDPGKVNTALFRRAYPALDPNSVPAAADCVPAIIALLQQRDNGKPKAI
jgi:NAD(P)-dependent dehydrogenase (short-subunit alcohol dehydrogenase family)